MIKFVPVEEVDIWMLVEFMEGKWAESSYAEDLNCVFNMDDTKELVEQIFAATPPPHGMVAIKHDVVVGLLIGALCPLLIEPKALTFQSMLFFADHCGAHLLKATEAILPAGTKLAVNVQKKNAERFKAFANRYGFIEMETVFIKKTGEEV